jgi:hypothetical protein
MRQVGSGRNDAVDNPTGPQVYVLKKPAELTKQSLQPSTESKLIAKLQLPFEPFPVLLGSGLQYTTDARSMCLDGEVRFGARSAMISLGGLRQLKEVCIQVCTGIVRRAEIE